MRAIILFLLLVVTAAYATLQEEDREGEVYQHVEGKLLFNLRTDIITAITTTTLPVAPTCFAQVATTTCAGRRKRRELKSGLLVNDAEMFDLESSQADESGVPSKPGLNQEKLQIWTTTRTTVVHTTTSTNAAFPTLTVNFSCTIAGINVPPLCG